MKNRSFALRCDAQQASTLAQAIQTYAHAAYPSGGSECAQVSRDALVTAANNIATHAATEQGAAISKRQRAMLKAAVKWYFSEDGINDSVTGARLLKLFQSK